MKTNPKSLCLNCGGPTGLGDLVVYPVQTLDHYGAPE